MKCTICKKTADETQLYTGILESDMVMICEECAESEGVPIIKKPSEVQLSKADERYSVRERMERMSGMHDAKQAKNASFVAQGDVTKLRVPPKKEYHEDVLDNYYWTLNIARRRTKLSINQLAESVKIDADILQSIEKGKIPENFEEIFLKLEVFLGIKLLKNHKKKLNFVRTRDEEQRILNDVKRKINPVELQNTDTNTATPHDSKHIKQGEKKEQLKKISKGEIDFSRKEDLVGITLNDLVEMKKKRESVSVRKKAKANEDAMFGDDLELDTDDL